MRPPPRFEAEELQTRIALGRERRDTEFKASISLAKKEPLAKVIRAAIALANHAGGGYLVIGVSEHEPGRFALQSVAEDDIASWRPAERVIETICKYTEPSVELDVFECVGCVVVCVAEFDRYPIVARQDISDAKGQLLVRAGALYVRPRGKLASMEPARLEDMQDLFDRFIARTQDEARAIAAGMLRVEREALSAERADLLRLIEDLRENLGKILADRRSSKVAPVLRTLLGARFDRIVRRSMQSEAKANLKAAFTAMKAFYQEKDRMPNGFAEAGFWPYPGGRYLYIGGPSELIGAEGSSDRSSLIVKGPKVLRDHGVDPRLGVDNFLIAAVTDFGEHGWDIWTIGPDGSPRNLTPTTTSNPR
jgi:hypothetical protein